MNNLQKNNALTIPGLRTRATATIILGLLLLAFLAAPRGVQAATVTWDGGGDGANWSDPLNWDGDMLPQSMDRIVIPAGAGEILLDIDFSLTGTLIVEGGGATLRIGSGTTLDIDPGMLAPGQFDNAIFQAGAALINDGVVEAVDPGDRPRITVSGTATNNDTVNNVNFLFRGTLINNGTINTGRLSTLGGTLTNNGAINDASVDFQVGAAISNAAGATFNITPTVAASRFLSGSVFDNHGIVTNTATITNQSTFNNFGTFDNTGGTFINACNIGGGVIGIFNNSGIFLGNPVSEECKAWDNDSGDGLWSNPLNWSGDSLPASTDDIVINILGGVDTAVTMDVNVTVGGILALRNSTGPPITLTLVIQNGVTLTNNGSITAGANTITNQGSIVNNGVLTINSCLINATSISVNPATCISTWDGEGGDGLWSTPANWSDDMIPLSKNRTVIPAGAGEILLDIDFSLTGTLIAEGAGATLRIGSGTTLGMDPGILAPGQFDNAVFQIGASLINDGVIEALDPGDRPRITVSGTATNNNTVNDVSFSFRGTLINNGTINTSRLSTLGGILTNNGIINDASVDFQVGAAVGNAAGAMFNITPTIAPSRFLSGTIFDNHGMVTNTATITNQSTFNNFGTFDNTAGSFDNQGVFNSECGSVLVGSISGNQPIVAVCDTTPPVITVPADITAEATSSSGADVTYTVTAIDETDGPVAATCNPQSGSGFDLGTTLVTCSATDAAGNTAVASFHVSVVDTTPPLFTFVPADILAEANAVDSTVAIGDATATDFFLDTVANDAPAVFPLGATIVTWTATDTSGNFSTATQQVTVVDTTPPDLTLPPDVTVTATGTLTVVDIGSSTATDIFEPVTITNDAPSAGFPVGATEVTWTATDANDNVATGIQRVNVVYQFGSFLSPLKPGHIYKAGRTLPVKIQVLLADGSLVPDLHATLSVQLLSNGVPEGEPLDIESTSAADSGNTFRLSDDLYIFNLSTASLSRGSYRLSVDLHDGSVPRFIDIGLR